MTIQEFYASINGDYEDITLRLPTEDMIKRFVKRFMTDGTYTELEKAIENEDINESFLAAHKLKGIAANLAFTELYNAVSALTEQLRPLTAQAERELMTKVTATYNKILVQYKLFESSGEK